MIPPLKPIVGWQGYSISEAGQVYSSKGKLKPIKTRGDGKVILIRNGKQTHFRPSDLVVEAWRPRWYDKERVK